MKTENVARSTDRRLDIEEELEARGDPLSLRAARYIRIKRQTLEGLEAAYRHLNRLLKDEIT